MPHQCTACGRVFPDGSKEMLSGCPDCGGNKFQYQPPGAAEAADRSTDPDDAPDSTPDPKASPRDDSPGPADAAGEHPSRAHEAAHQPAEPGNDASSPADHSDSDRTGRVDDGASASPPVEEPVNADVETGGDRSTSTTDGTNDPHSSEETRSATERASAAVRDWVGLGSDDGPDTSGKTPPNSAPTREDRAQADARSGVVGPDEIAAAGGPGNRRQSTPDASDDDSVASDDARPESSSGSQVIEPDSDERPSIDELRQELNDQFESIRIVNPGQYELNLMELYNRDEYIISLREDGRYVIEVADSWRSPDDE